MRIRIVVVLLMSFALPALGNAYKYAYPVACSEIWGAVKDTLANPDNYANVQSDDASMTAAYSPRHSVHFDVTGVILQCTNHVTLVSAGPGCEMQVVSNYSGWGHEDQGDFKKRVEESIAKPKEAKASESPKAAAPAR